MPKSKHRRKKGIGRARVHPGRAVQQGTVREFNPLEREELLARLYGPEPEDDYALWQRYAVDLMVQGIAREVAEGYAYQREQLMTRLCGEMFSTVPGDELSNWQWEQIWKKAVELLPPPLPEM